MNGTYKTPIWFYTEAIDFRKQIDGLVILIADALDKSPGSGELFIFRNRRRNKLKCLWYDLNGFWLCYKRLEKGRFIFPTNQVGAIELTQDQLNWLLSGLDFSCHKPWTPVNAQHFF